MPLSSRLIESELFGDERGACTGATVHRLASLELDGPMSEHSLFEAMPELFPDYRWLEGFGLARRHNQDQD